MKFNFIDFFEKESGMSILDSLRTLKFDSLHDMAINLGKLTTKFIKNFNFIQIGDSYDISPTEVFYFHNPDKNVYLIIQTDNGIDYATEFLDILNDPLIPNDLKKTQLHRIFDTSISLLNEDEFIDEMVYNGYIIENIHTLVELFSSVPSKTPEENKLLFQKFINKLYDHYS